MLTAATATAPAQPDAKLCLDQYQRACTEFKTDPARRDKVFAAVDQKNLALLLQNFPHAIDQNICIELLRMLLDPAFTRKPLTITAKTKHATSWQQLVSKIQTQHQPLWREICNQVLVKGSCMHHLFGQDFMIANEQSVLRDTISVKDKALAYFAYGDSLQRTGQYNYAIAAFTDVISLTPSAAAGLAYVRRGACHSILGQYQQAIENYHKAITKLRPHAETEATDAQELYYASHSLGVIYCLSRDYRSAEQTFNDVLKRQPQSSLTLLLRGLNYERAGEIAKATADFQAVVKAQKTDLADKLWAALRLYQWAKPAKTKMSSIAALAAADTKAASASASADVKKTAVTISNPPDLAALCKSFQPRDINDHILLCLAESAVATTRLTESNLIGGDKIEAILAHPDFPHKIDPLLIGDWFDLLLNQKLLWIQCLRPTTRKSYPWHWVEVFTILKHSHEDLWQRFITVASGNPINNYFAGYLSRVFLDMPAKDRSVKHGLLDSIIDDDDIAAAQFQAACSYMDASLENAHEKAAELLTDYLAHSEPSRKSEALYRRGICYVNMQQYANAVADSAACLPEPNINDINRALALLQRGYAFAKMGEQTLARADIEEFLTLYTALKPADKNSKFQLDHAAMQAHVLLGKYHEAARYFESRADEWLREFDFHPDQIRIEASLIYCHLGEYTKASKLALEATKDRLSTRLQDTVSAHLQLQMLAYLQGDDAQVQQYPEKILSAYNRKYPFLNLRFAVAYLVSGLSFLRQGKLTEAKQAFTQVFEYPKIDASIKTWARLHLARLELKLGNAATNAGSSAATALVKTTSSSGVHLDPLLFGDAVHDPRILDGSPLAAPAYKTSAAPRGDDVNSVNRYDVKDVKSNNAADSKATIPDLAELCSSSTNHDVNGAALQCLVAHFLTQSSDTLKQLDHTDFSLEISRILTTYTPLRMEPMLRGEWIELLLKPEVRPLKLNITNPQELAQQWLLMLRSIRFSHPRVWLNACIQACLPQTAIGQIFTEGWMHASVICSKQSALAQVLLDLTSSGIDLENLDLDRSTLVALAYPCLDDDDRLALLTMIPGLKGKLKEPLGSFEMDEPAAIDREAHSASPTPSSWK